MYKPKTGINAGIRNKKDIEELLKSEPDITGVEISKRLKLNLKSVYKHLATMRK